VQPVFPVPLAYVRAIHFLHELIPVELVYVPAGLHIILETDVYGVQQGRIQVLRVEVHAVHVAQEHTQVEQEILVAQIVQLEHINQVLGNQVV
jgi:hypothetical protein